MDFIAELFDLLVAFLALLGGGGDTDKVLEKLRAGLLLEEEGKLDSTVKEVGDDLDVFLDHVTRRKSGCAETDTTGNLGGSVTGNSILCKGDVI